MATIVSYSGKDLKRMADAVTTASTEVMKQYNAIKDANASTGIGGTAGELMTATLTETDTTMEQLGRARQIKVQKENTIIVDGMGDKQEIAKRVALLKAQIAEEKSEFEKENLQERLAKIAGGVAVIGVGAATEVEMKDRKLRIEDALSATKAAVEEGIVPGGGTAYIDILPKVTEVVEQLHGDEKIGGKIILRALEEPARQI